MTKQKLLPLIRKYHTLKEKAKMIEDQLDELNCKLKDSLNEGITTIGNYRISKLKVPIYTVEEYKGGGYFKLEVRKL